MFSSPRPPPSSLGYSTPGAFGSLSSRPGSYNAAPSPGVPISVVSAQDSDWARSFPPVTHGGRLEGYGPLSYHAARYVNLQPFTITSLCSWLGARAPHGSVPPVPRFTGPQVSTGTVQETRVSHAHQSLPQHSRNIYNNASSCGGRGDSKRGRGKASSSFLSYPVGLHSSPGAATSETKFIIVHLPFFVRICRIYTGSVTYLLP